MAAPVEKKKKHSAAEHRLIFENEQQSLGSFVTAFGERRSVRVAMKRSRRWVCSDIWMDIFPHFERPQLGLKLALLSPRFNALVDAHFGGKAELTLWRLIEIHKCRVAEVPKLSVTNSNGKFGEFLLLDHPLPSKMRFNCLSIHYIDDSVLAFLCANKQIWDKGTILHLNVGHYTKTNDIAHPIWNALIREILPIFAPNIRHLNFPNDVNLDNLLRLTSSATFLSDLNISSIDSDYLLPAGIGDFDGPNTIARKVLNEWLHTPTKDGQPKRLICRDCSENSLELDNKFKQEFLRATTSSVTYIIALELDASTKFKPFELVNERTNEKLTLSKDEGFFKADVTDEEAQWLMLKRCQIGGTVQWENENSNNLNNNVHFWLYGDCIGPLSPPKALKMNPGPSGQRN